MERGTQSVACLDTHIVVWLYSGLKQKFTKAAEKRINQCDLYISQFVRLELKYLFEIGRITKNSRTIIPTLSKDIGLKLSKVPLNLVMDEALKISWTRDVFDRLIIAETIASNATLITADKTIRDHFSRSVW